MTEITIQKPDDWHLHFRDGDMLQETVAATIRCFQRAVVMPNLVPPVVNAEMAFAYRERIKAFLPSGRKNSSRVLVRPGFSQIELATTSY